MSWKWSLLRIQIWWMIMEETASTTGASTFCQRMTHNLAQDSLFNKVCIGKLGLARCRLHSKEQRWNKLRDRFSFPELDRLVVTNYLIRRGWFVVRRLKYTRWSDALSKFCAVDFPWSSESECRDCSNRMRMVYWYRSKLQSTAGSTLWGSVQILCQWQPFGHWSASRGVFLAKKSRLFSPARGGLTTLPIRELN